MIDTFFLQILICGFTVRHIITGDKANCASFAVNNVSAVEENSVCLCLVSRLKARFYLDHNKSCVILINYYNTGRYSQCHVG